MKVFAAILLVEVLLLGLSSGQIAPQKYTHQPNPCTSKSSCHDCIQTPSCAWCNDPKFAGVRCFQPSEDPMPGQDTCAEEHIHNPDNIESIISDWRLSKAHSIAGEGAGHWASGYEGSYNYSEYHSEHGSSSGSWGGSGGGYSGQRIVQVQPQRINLKLRAKQSYKITMKYTQAEDYPVDLYYLMDLSKSMSDDKEKLSQLGTLLAETMNKITSNFRLGFGSFVDKVVMPFVSTVPQKLLKPCESCVAPYGFQHHLVLTTNTTMFTEMVRQANVSGNLDAPEGGFDAIMQAVVCRDKIGWREQARRLLVFSTDASFHFAGDGKLGGIVKPNDGQCHLSRSGIYTESSSQDYPSIEQINMNVKKNSINVIFAVTNTTIGVYEQLAKHIEGASTAQLQSDSSNIVDIVRDQYQQISSSVEMKHNASSAVSIKFFTNCLDDSGTPINTNKCGKIKVGDVINFNVELEVLKCPKDPSERFQTIQIYPVGINESLIIDLEMLCSCNCERPGDRYYEELSPYCSSQGTYKCGVCDCYSGAFGRLCECTADAQSNKMNKTNGCVEPNSTTGLECSGKGQCVCGRCECEARGNENENIYGDFCECDNFSCERHDGKLCSGPSHGVCDCGQCICKEGWTGSNCACQKSNHTCLPHGVVDGLICSGHGVCECGKCKCDASAEGRYSGRLCEKCPTCSDRCLEFKDCVECQQYHTGVLKDPEACSANCTQFVPISVKEVDEVVEENNEIKCTVFNEEDGCRFAFIYYFDEENKLQVKAQQERECPPKIFVPGVVIGVIAAIVLLGVAILLLWKLITTIHDRKEFARFERERMKAKWDTGENPIYKQATSTFKNPTYTGKG